MTRIPVIVIAFLFCTGYTSAFADDLTEIKLLDGSVIYGEIVSLNEGIYTVNSASLGMLEIEGSQILLIRLKAESPAAGTTSGDGDKLSESDIKALSKSMNLDETVIDLIISMQNDPEIHEIIKDPDIMNALIKHDTAALLANPKIIKLLKNPKFKAIQKKIAKEKEEPSQ